MPSSLIFAALAGAWLVVLVPMIAKRRQEVVRTADSALASRVLRRPEPSHHGEEVPTMTERTAHPEPQPVAPADGDERRFRPGRGGYDPEAAALAARARYAFRQRIVVGLLLAAVATLVLALVMSSTYWWAHAAFDIALVGYLGYLRRQVRIEEEVRRRRAARLDTARRRPAAQVRHDERAGDEAEHRDQADYPDGEEHPDDSPQPAEPVVRTVPAAVVHPTAVAVDLDDEDPAFDELDPSFEPPYRRAAGE
jgi:hypothetical protein